MRILLPYAVAAAQRGLADEWHLWDYCRQASDSSYLREMERAHPTFIKVFVPAGEGGEEGDGEGGEGKVWKGHKHGFTAVYQHYAKLGDRTGYTGFGMEEGSGQYSGKYNGKSTIVKVDDDIVWMGLDQMQGFLQYREGHPEHFFVSANVVNNGVCAFHQQEHGASIRAWNLPREHKEYGKVGSVWCSKEYGKVCSVWCSKEYGKVSSVWCSKEYGKVGSVWCSVWCSTAVVAEAQ
jgi:hypothetical protein